MPRIILLSLVWIGLLASLPLVASELNSPTVNQNFEGQKNLPISQSRPTYQRGYTVHYRSPRDRKWTLEGFHADRRDADRVAMRLQRSGFSTQVRSRAAAERRRTGGY
jgi:hypothetical protein